MCIQYNKVHIINTRIKSTEDSTEKFKTISKFCGPQHLYLLVCFAIFSTQKLSGNLIIFLGKIREFHN